MEVCEISQLGSHRWLHVDFLGTLDRKRCLYLRNALRVNDIETSFNTGRAGIEAFERFKGEIEAIPDLKNKTEVLYDYVHSQLSKMNGEVYSQPLTTVGFGGFSNIYSYIRSKDGYGQECLVLAAPLDYEPSIVYILTFVELMTSQKPDWQSKDILILFYP